MVTMHGAKRIVDVSVTHHRPPIPGQEVDMPSHAEPECRAENQTYMSPRLLNSSLNTSVSSAFAVTFNSFCMSTPEPRMIVRGTRVFARGICTKASYKSAHGHAFAHLTLLPLSGIERFQAKIRTPVLGRDTRPRCRSRRSRGETLLFGLHV